MPAPDAGLGAYAASAVGSLVTDTFSVSKSLANATMGAMRRLYSKPSSSTTSMMKSKEPKAFSSGDNALTDADGFVAEADRFLIMGNETVTTHPEVTDNGNPPQPLHLADVMLVSEDMSPEAPAAAGSHDPSQAESAPVESSEQVAKLGEAAIAVNEAEDSLVEVAEELETGRSRDMLRGVVQEAKGQLPAAGQAPC